MTTPFVLALDATGRASTVTVDGHDLSEDVLGLELVTAAGEAPRLVLHMPGAGEVIGNGIVTVMRDPTEQEMRERLGSWLAELDPSVIDAEVSARMTSMRDSYAAKVLEVLAEAARG